jgi:hypothetical protein
MAAIRKGTLLSFSGSFGSGLGTLDIRDAKTKKIDSVPCDNGPTVRALEAAFGDTITAGHRANGNGYKGWVVYWVVDDVGVLAGFTPAGEATEKLRKAYRLGQ